MFKTFRPVLKPSSVGEKNNVSTRDSNKKQLVERAPRTICVQFPENVARDLCACQRLVDLWDGDVVISRMRVLD